MTTLIPKFQQTGTGASNRAINLKLAETVSLADFGADATGATDSTTAIVNAIASLPTSGGTLYYKGKFLVASTIIVDKAIRLVADGGKGDGVNTFPSSYFIKKATLNGPCLKLTEAGIIMEGGGVLGEAGTLADTSPFAQRVIARNAAAGGDGIHVLGGRITLRDVTVNWVAEVGIKVGAYAGEDTNSNVWCLDRCTANYNGDHGISISDDGLISDGINANAGICIGANISNNVNAGVFVNAAFGNTFTGLVSQTNKYGAYFAADSTTNTLYGGDFEGNTTEQIVLATDCHRNSVVFPAGNNDFNIPTDLFGLTNDGIDCPAYVYPRTILWTPTLVGSQGGTPTYDSQLGWISVEGTKVTVGFRIGLTSAAGYTTPATSVISIGGLPVAYAPKNDAAIQGIVGSAMWRDSVNSLDGLSISMQYNTTTTITLGKSSGAGGTNNQTTVKAADLDNTFNIWGTITYMKK